MLVGNKRTSDSKMGRAPAAQGSGLLGVLMDAQGMPVGPTFPVRMSVAVAGEVHNEEAIRIRADRAAYVTCLLITKDGQDLASVALLGPANVTPNDTLSFNPGDLTITMTGVTDSAVTALFAGEYVIHEEACLDD